MINEGSIHPHNGSILSTILPDKKGFLNFWSPPTYSNTNELITKSGVAPNVVQLYILSITSDIRFILYSTLFTKVLPIWSFISITILLGVLYTSSEAGSVTFIFSIIWLLIFFLGLIGCVVTRRYLRLGLQHCIKEANMKIIPEGIISYANDCGDTICVRYGLVFVKYQLDDCHTDVMKHIRVNNAHNPIKINLEEASINGMATCLLAKHSYEYLKALFKNRLLFPRSPREGVSEFAPKHHLTSWCLCQYVEKFEFNPEKKSLLDWII